MSVDTLQVPDELAIQLRGHEDQIPRILELGLKELANPTAAASPQLQEVSRIIEFIARQPAPQEIMDLKPSEGFERRVEELLEKNREERLGGEDLEEWDRYMLADHLVSLRKRKRL